MALKIVHKNNLKIFSEQKKIELIKRLLKPNENNNEKNKF